MQEQRLAPGGHRRDAPRPGSEIFGSAQQLQQRVVHAGTQPLGHHVDVGLPQLSAFVGLMVKMTW
jgi:hypothetical protein